MSCTYIAETYLLVAAAELLRLPFPVTETALTLLHRYSREKGTALTSDDIAPCIFLASKVEEAPVRTNDMLNTLEYLRQCQQRQRGSTLVAEPPPLQNMLPAVDAMVLVGDLYYAKKQELIIREQSLLRLIHFNVVCEHPHRYLFNFGRALHCPARMLHLAVCLVNDSLCTTQLSLDQSAANVAAGALHLSSLLLGQAWELPFKDNCSWWDALGVHLEKIEAVGAAMLAMLERTKVAAK